MIFALQSLYSELLHTIQGVLPESMYVVPPGEAFQPEQYRVLGYAAYYRYVKSRPAADISRIGNPSETYPEPTPHCEVCRWRPDCEAQRRTDTIYR